MAKYDEKLVQRIVMLMEEDTYSITEICGILKISRKSFYEWKDTKSDFREALEKTTERCNERMLMTARRSLRRKLEGYTLTETRTTYVPDEDNPGELRLKSKVVREKEYAPDTRSIKLVLERNDSKTDNDEQQHSPYNIIVRTQEAADSIRLLEKRLRSESDSRGMWWNETAGEAINKEKIDAESEKTEKPKEPQKKVEEEKKVELPAKNPLREPVTRDVGTEVLPPGYTHRG